MYDYVVSFHLKGFSDRPKSALLTRQLSYDSVPNRQGLSSLNEGSLKSGKW